MTPTKCEEIGKKKFQKRRRSIESRTNSSDTKNVIGDLASKPKIGKQREGIKNLDAELSDNSLINATKFAVEKKSRSKQVQVDTFKFKDSTKPPAKSPAGDKKATTKPKTPQLKKTRSKKVAEEPSDKPEPQPHAAPKPKKPWMRYPNMAQNALSLLNNEVSSALCQVLGSIDDIQMRVRATMDEIQQCDKVTDRLHNEKGCHSSPMLADELLHSAANVKLPRALQVGLLQTQSENQMRIALETPVAIIEQSDREISKHVDSNSESEVTIVEAKKVEPTPSNLPRKAARSNLHKCPEFEAKDSLHENERRVGSKKGKKKSKVIQILAEELYVPEKVNKIMESSLPTDESKSKRFMYQRNGKEVQKEKQISQQPAFCPGRVDRF